MTEEQNELLSRVSAQEVEIKSLETLLMKEKKRGDSDKKSAELEKKKAAELRKLLEIEKSKVEEARKLADTERRKAEELTLSFARLKTELNQVRDELIKERSKLHDLEVKIDQEKQKNTRKRKHAEIERAKAEKGSMILKLEMKKAMDEKMIDHLRQQLDGEKQKREEYERKLLAMVHAQGVEVNADKSLKVDSNNKAQVKLLKEQLKLAKEQVKHYKRKARLEKSEKLRIRQLFHIQELSTLKLSHHLKLLGDQLSQSIEDTVSLEKAKSSYSPDLNLQMMNFGVGPSEADFLLTNSCNSSDFKRQCNCFNLSRRNCIRQPHSRKSDLQSLTKDSVRSKPPNSAVCSATTMLSNGKILDPQGDATFVVSSSKFSESLLKQKLKKMRYNHEAGKDIHDDGVISKSNKRCGNKLSESIEKENPKTLSCRGKQVSSHEVDERRYIHEAGKDIHDDGVISKANKRCGNKLSESIEKENSKKLSCQGKKVSNQEVDEGNLKMTGNNLKCVDGKFNQFSLKKGEMLLHSNADIRHAKIFRSEEDKQQTLNKKYNIQNRNLKLGSKSSVLSSSFNSTLFDDQMSTDLPLCKEGTLDSIDTQWPDLVRFENMTLGDCLKLLELDDSADEKRFNEAIERPLSPALAGIPEEHANAMLSVKCGIGETIVKPCQTHDVIDPKICSNRLETEVPLSVNQISNDYFGSFYASEEANCRDVSTFQGNSDKFMVVENSSASTDMNASNLQADSSLECLVGACNYQMLERFDYVPAKENDSILLPCVDERGTKEKNIGSNVLDFPFQDGHELLHSESKKYSNLEGLFVGSEKTSEAIVCSTSHHLENNDLLSVGSYCIEALKHFFLGPDTKDEDSMSRIIQASKMLAVEKLDQCQTDCFLAKLLESLSLEVHLQHQERIFVVFSLLLWNLSSTISTSPSRLKAGDIFLFSKSFAAQMHRVMADEATRLLFLDMCPIDILLDLIEEFLIKRSILMCKDLEYELTCSSVSTVATYHLKELNMFLIETTAEVDQLIAASMMLASFCFVFSEIDFLVGTSYKILRIHKSDVSFNLLALHVFQSVYGKEIFTAAKCKCSLAAIKTMVCYLENGYSSYPRSTSDVAMHFEPCVQCPFSDDAIGIEEFTSSLLSMLEYSSLSGNNMLTMPECVHAKEERTHQSSSHGDMGAACDASCLFFKYSKCGDSTSGFTPERTFCWFTDVVSIVELFSHYMSWSWMYDNVLPRLLKIISSCPLDEYAAAIISLVGQIGRFGIDFGGYQQNGIKELLCNLSDYLDACVRRKNSLSKQLATVGAMVNLLPFRFREIVDGCHERSVDSKHSPQIKLLKEWFSCLSNRQQYLVLDLFKDEPQ